MRRRDKERVLREVGGELLPDGSFIVPLGGPHGMAVMNALLAAYSGGGGRRRRVARVRRVGR